jgi:hypothetical protein
MDVERLYGSRTLRPSMRGLEVKGTLVASRRRIVESSYGESGVAQVARLLKGVTRELFVQPPFATSWQPIERLVEIDACVVSELHQGQVRQMRQIGAAVAEHDLSTLYRTLMRIGRPAFVAQRINIAYMTYIRQGNMRTTSLEARAAEVELHETALPRYMCEHHISGWVEAAMALSGATRVEVIHSACRHEGEPLCRWHIAWDEP